MKNQFSKINRAAALCAVAFITLAAPCANAGRFILPPGPGPTTIGNDGKVSQNRIRPKPLPLPPKVAGAVRDPSFTGIFIGTLKGN
jgi:hypothetical protein